MSNLADTVGSCAFSVDNALGDPFSCEVGEFVDQVEVLKKNGAVGTSSERVLVVVDRVTLGVSDKCALHSSRIKSKVKLFSLKLN